jgi:uncharacterized membrane protein
MPCTTRLFYRNNEDPDGPPTGGFDNQENNSAPDPRDFIYLAFAVARTSGVTDIEVTSKLARRTVAKHAMLSSACGTVVLALVVNVVTNLLSGGE